MFIKGVAVIYGRYVRKITKRVQDTLADSTKIAEERIANVKTVKMFGHESREMQTYDHSILNVLRIAYKEAKARALFYGMVSFRLNKKILNWKLEILNMYGSALWGNIFK